MIHKHLFLKTAAALLLSVCFLLETVSASEKKEFSLFPERLSGLYLTTLDFSQLLHAGVENGIFYTRGRFGMDFPLVGKDDADSIGAYRLGVVASAHLNMIPRNMKFSVDNFYAVLGIYTEMVRSETFRFRLYPLYHLSAHLADGHIFSDELFKAEAVSSEMVLAEISWLPIDKLEARLVYGYYYHTVAQKELVQRVGFTSLYRPFSAPAFEPFVIIKHEWIFLGKWQTGNDVSAGLLFRKNNATHMAVNLRYFDLPHQGYYFRQRERGWGVEIQFLP